jgi:hypothetical protein
MILHVPDPFVLRICGILVVLSRCLHVPDPFVLSRMSNMWHAVVQDLCRIYCVV